MTLTPEQLATLNTHIKANTNQINGVQIKDMPNNSDANEAIANWYKTTASPDYWVWGTGVTRSTVYHTVTDLPSVFDWATYKAQAVTEQGAWTQMFMGDSAPFSNLSLRNGVFRIFSGSGAQNAQRAHIFACARRKASNIEKLFAAAPVNIGGITVSVDNGNTVASAAGSTTNPFVMGYEGSVSAQDIETARNLG